MPRTLKVRINVTAVLALVLLVGGAAWAALKVWVSGETVRASDLNSNFTQVYNAATANITNSRIDNAAAISHSKLATPSLVPKAIIGSASACLSAADGASCTLAFNYGATITAVRTSEGFYTMTWGVARANSVYMPQANSYITTDSDAVTNYCVSVEQTTSTFVVKCYTHAGTISDTRFMVVVYDDDN